MAKDVKCTKPDCDCAEKEEQRIGGPIKYGYPCLADHPDLMKEKTRSALNKELTVQEQAEKFARCRIGDMGSLMDGFFAGHSLANDRIKELEEKLSSLKASMDILVDDNERLSKRGMRWVKGKPKDPSHRQKLNIKFDGDPAAIIFIEDRWCYYNDRGVYAKVRDSAWALIEYLDESESIISKCVSK